MSNDIVIVPTYDRPEYLTLCLEKLFAAEGIENKQVWIAKDNHADVEQDPQIVGQLVQVISDAEDAHSGQVRYIRRTPHKFYGNSYNVLEAFREASQTDASHVYLVEDDVMVMPDFFKWHEAAQEQFKPFVSCAGRINRSLNFAMNGPDAIDESCQDPLACVRSKTAYGSWAACFDREILRKFVAPYAQDFFYAGIKPGFEQDIIIQKQMQVRHGHLIEGQVVQFKDSPGFSVWPYIPRAYHMGWYSYHRTAGMKFNGLLEEKVRSLRDAISDVQKIRTMACLQEIDPYPVTPVTDWSGPLYIKQGAR